MIDLKDIRRFYRRLDHAGYGVTEFVVIDPSGKEGVIATGFFNCEEEFVKACQIYNAKYNIYAGRNPRPAWFSKTCGNYLDTKYKQRASDNDIEFVTAISLDIDPIRPKGTSATDEQKRRAIEFAVSLHNDIGGWVDDSGNGAYLWIPFRTAISVNNTNREEIRQKCRTWQSNIVRLYPPEKKGLKIDGCFDLSRLKKVIGTLSVKGSIHRLSKLVMVDHTPDDKVRDAILAQHINDELVTRLNIPTSANFPARFLILLQNNQTIKELWLTPNTQNDTSMHDWMLGSELAKEGFTPEEIAQVLMINPFGKFQRDRRYGYIRITVSKIMGEKSGSG